MLQRIKINNHHCLNCYYPYMYQIHSVYSRKLYFDGYYICYITCCNSIIEINNVYNTSEFLDLLFFHTHNLQKKLN